MWGNATKVETIRSVVRDYIMSNGITLDMNKRKIGDKLVALEQQGREALKTAYHRDTQLLLNQQSFKTPVAGQPVGPRSPTTQPTVLRHH
ncbi:hypothetical protein E4U61_003378 [Claviceps capensis]|nr:hypothetical protein E4U61_003378 [Claviceps capensis]